LKHGTGLRALSTKRQGEYTKYSKCRNAYLALHPVCERCGAKPSKDIHHKAGRHGRFLCDTAYFSALCRACHEQVHANGNEARKQGWIIDVHQRDQVIEVPDQD